MPGAEPATSLDARYPTANCFPRLGTERHRPRAARLELCIVDLARWMEFWLGSVVHVHYYRSGCSRLYPGRSAELAPPRGSTVSETGMVAVVLQTSPVGPARPAVIHRPKRSRSSAG